jgi:hypothetical protein
VQCVGNIKVQRFRGSGFRVGGSLRWRFEAASQTLALKAASLIEKETEFHTIYMV